MPRTTPAEACHRIAIAGHDVAYLLRRSRRRTIGLTIDQRGLRVGAPQGARLGDIEALIHRHGQWVLDKLNSWREHVPADKFEVGNGAEISLLGETLQLTVTPLGRARWQFVGNTLHLWPSATASARQLFEKALRERARAVFLERLGHYAPLLGVATPPLRLSSARTRWGSCSHQGGIALNWRLIFMPLPVLDYVVAHELAHLREMNHSPRFWAVVEQLCPDWRERRLELKQRGQQLPVL